MRELVVKYLSKGVSRRGFVTGLTQAGLTMTAAQGVLASVSTVSYAQGTAPVTPPTGGPAGATAVTGSVKSFQGHDGFEEVLNQEQIVQPITKYTWLARRADMIPETVRRAFKAAWTPPYGPSYISWHSDFNDEQVRTEIIAQDQVDPRMRVRPNPEDVQRAAKLLVEARMPVMIVGDEIYKAKAAAKAVKLAELLGMPVTQVRQLYANFPEGHPLWVGNVAGGGLNSLTWPKGYDVVLNVGN